MVRWIHVGEGQSIAWSVEPHKKSINFGIFKHPGTKGGLTPTLPTQETVDTSTLLPETPGLDGVPPSGKRGRQGSIGKHQETSAALEKLQGIGLKSVAWTGRCEADKVTMGRYDVKPGEDGMYGLVLDNTFSKQTSKTVHFVLMTHPTNAVPKSGHHLHYSQATAATPTPRSASKGFSPSLGSVADSSESLQSNVAIHMGVLEDPRPNSRGKGIETKGIEGSTFYTGVLHKKRRKRGQGYARRFFSLDFTSSTLSYYRDRHSSALRGAMPLSLAAIGANEQTKEFSMDSGAEVWHLKALNRKDFEGWRDAFERASRSIAIPSAPQTPATSLIGLPKLTVLDPVEDLEWQRLEQLVSKVSGTRDAIRGLAKDTDPKYFAGVNGTGLGLTTSGNSSGTPSPSSYESANPYFPDIPEERNSDTKRPFWKRKSSAERSPAGLLRRSVSAQLVVPSPSGFHGPLPSGPSMPTIVKKPSLTMQSAASITDDVHERCMALLRDLDNVVSDFAVLIAENKVRRHPLPTSASRMSIESVDNEEFFDAEEGGRSPSQLLSLRTRDDDDEGPEDRVMHHDHEADSDASSDTGTARSVMFASTPKASHQARFPRKPQSLPPLPLPHVQRRRTVQSPKQSPPSIIGFLRKNAGKDLSTVSMPVTANEPTSLLQRLAESVEYSHLLDSAASTKILATERLMYIAAFAISYFANNRVKERAIRKPFNPMLGETYELVREDLGYRFIAEKVSHHPVRMACQAESLNNGGWCFTQSPRPDQKFWGKSVELNTDGRARVVLQEAKESYSWNQATCFLRNVIAGEKYVEPVQNMTVLCETTGLSAVVTFKSGGMFSGRSEEVTAQLFDPSADASLPLGLTGKWTESLKRTDTGDTIWTVGSLVPDASKTYGFTTFAAELNEVTEIEDGHIAPTDSRLRPDQQALEIGEVDQAEAMKAKLEERQRARRKLLETHGRSWQPQFFERASDGNGDSNYGNEEVWLLKEKLGYWERRQLGNWDGIQEVFES